MPGCGWISPLPLLLFHGLFLCTWELSGICSEHPQVFAGCVQQPLFIQPLYLEARKCRIVPRRLIGNSPHDGNHPRELIIVRSGDVRFT
jgi:hypothetical protein